MALNTLQLADWIDEDVAKTISEKNMWNSTHRLLRFVASYSKMEEYLREGTHTDVNIICEGNVFKCHRVVLAAVSEYFHSMFRDGNFKESRAEDVVLKDIDSVTFEQILLYAYKGEIVAMNDDNVFNLLRSSDILGLNEIEKFCIHYLTQKSIPMDRALEIYLFASASHKVSLIPAISRFILQHMDRFSEESTFLNMCLEDFSNLLTYFRASSSTMSQETRLLNAILKWVRHSTDIHEERRSSYFELAGKVDFKFVSAEYVSDYFLRYSAVDSNNENNRSEASEEPDCNSGAENNESSLHVYAKTYGREHPDGPVRSQMSIVTLQENGSEDINWHHTHYVTSPPIDMMRVVECDGRLYSMKLCENKWTFTSSTSLNLLTDVQSLQTPSIPDPQFLMYNNVCFAYNSLCRLRKCIYYVDLYHKFLCYNIDLDVWSATIPLVSANYDPLAIVSDDNRLYVIGEDNQEHPRNRHFVAYDPRAARVDELPKIRLKSSSPRWSSGCYHKGRIYVTDSYFFTPVPQPRLNMAVYDVAAGRWDLHRMYSELDSHQLVSFNNRLFKFEFDSTGYIYCKIFDSYLQTWNNDSYYREKLSAVMERSNCSWLFMDVIAFQS